MRHETPQPHRRGLSLVLLLHIGLAGRAQRRVVARSRVLRVGLSRRAQRRVVALLRGKVLGLELFAALAHQRELLADVHVALHCLLVLAHGGLHLALLLVNPPVGIAARARARLLLVLVEDLARAALRRLPTRGLLALGLHGSPLGDVHLHVQVSRALRDHAEPRVVRQVLRIAAGETRAAPQLPARGLGRAADVAAGEAHVCEAVGAADEEVLHARVERVRRLPGVELHVVGPGLLWHVAVGVAGDGVQLQVA
mmetsp:Transcript_36974/g.115819  ORF Transcript_36974/g.115819 Transcript_36974/m.115819 type:complete len:254 (-) Transcript_36974:2310-3071(-)